MSKRNLWLLWLLLPALSLVPACKDDEPLPEPPFTVDLSKVPYTNLSEYGFFEGAMKDQRPIESVLPYRPASSLFSDYAHKKRFVWMPDGSKATYDGDDNIFNFPVGTVLIKTFYYDNVQPENISRNMETRLLVRKADGWKAYTYAWNADQTEAVLDAAENGMTIPVTFLEGGVTKNINYKIPSQGECITCHKINPTGLTGGELTTPIGPKPQNLNFSYSYGSVSMNQIAKWKEMGYLGNDIPSNIVSTVDWEDASQTLDLRARSYLDMNCGHCHREGGHCDYVNVRFNFSNTNDYDRGICQVPLFIVQNASYVIHASRASRSEMYMRITSNLQEEMMPIIGRSVVHTEGTALIRDWINAMPDTCP